MPRRLTALLAIGLTMLGVAACGGEDESDYGDEFRGVSRQLVSLGQEVGDSLETAGESTNRELAADFNGYADELGELRGKLEELDPPEDLSDEQDDLVAAVGEVRASLADIGEAAERGDPDGARQATEDLIQHSADLRDARRTLSEAVSEEG